MGPDSPTPVYRAPDGRTRTLRVGLGGLVMIQGVPNGAQVAVSDFVTKIKVPRDARYHCSDGTTLDVRIDESPPHADPCSHDR